MIAVMEIDGMTTGDYDALTADMAAHAGDGSGHPAVSHAAAVGENGLVVVDVWGSEQEFGKFGQDELAPRMGGSDGRAEAALRQAAQAYRGQEAGRALRAEAGYWPCSNASSSGSVRSAVGSTSRRASGIGSPLSMESPYRPSFSRSSARSTAASWLRSSSIRPTSTSSW